MESDIDFLLDHATDAVKIRVAKEIKKDLPATQESIFISKINYEKNIKHIFDIQDSKTGWIGSRFHGIEPGDSFSGAEIALRYLFEKGYTTRDNRVKRAIEALSRVEEIFPWFSSNTDDIGGYNKIRASLYVRAEEEDIPSVKMAISNALIAFKNVFKYKGFESITDIYRKHHIFKEDFTWPDIYDLRILAHSHSWRSSTNLKVMADSVARLAEILPLKDKIYVKIKDRFYAPAQAIIDFIVPDIDMELGNLDFWWFDRMELFARIGIINRVELLRNQLEKLKRILRQDSGIFKARKMSNNFRTWNAYHGLSLEPSLRKKESKWSDYTFRCALIEHYAKL